MWKTWFMVLACLTALWAPVNSSANGTAFFYPKDDTEKTNPDALVYFGSIKDTKGNFVNGVQVYVLLLNYSKTIPVRNVHDAHYRSPDVNGMLKEVGGKVEPEKIQIAIIHRDYKLARPVFIPRRTTGIHNVDIVLEARKP